MPPTDPLGLGELAGQEEELVKQVQRLGQLLYDPNKTDEEWNEQVQLLTLLHPYYTNPDNKGVFNKLVKQAGYDADAFSRAALGASSSIDPSQILSGALNTRTSRDIASQTSTTSRTARTTTTYVDMPTPEEFLDSFDRMFGVHLQGLVASGGIRPEVAAFAEQNKSLFYDEYLREQIGNLLKGQPLFKTVGLNADEKLIGSRKGEVTQDKGVSEQDRTTTSAEQQSGVPSETPLGKAIESTGNLTERERSTSTYDNLLDTTEAIIQRNGLAVVATLSPLDFLKSKAEEKRLNLLYAGQKGSAQRGAQTATGQDFSGAARRI